jgi:N-acetylneuraminic acid mutarotase
VTVTLRDGDGATVTGFTGYVTLQVMPEPAGDSWVPYPTAQALSGVARFERFAVPVTGRRMTLVATAEPATPVTSAPFSVSASPWESRAAAPTQRMYAASAAADGRLYVAGGTSDTEDFTGYLATMDAYDPVSNGWSSRAPMPTARVRAGAAALDGLIYVAGGNDGSGLLATVEVYDPATDQWATRAPMQVARAHPALVAFDGRLYAIGGIGDGGAALATVEVYDPATDQWSTRRSMTDGRALSGAAVEGGIVYAVGGGFGFTPSTLVQAYNPVSNTWSSRASLPNAQGFSGIVAAGGRVLVVAGVGEQGVVNDVGAYDPASNTWARIASIPWVGGLTYAGVVDGVVYAVVDGVATFALPVPAM